MAGTRPGPVLAFAAVSHGRTFLIAVAMGVMFLWFDGITFGRLFRFPRRRSQDVD